MKASQFPFLQQFWRELPFSGMPDSYYTITAKASNLHPKLYQSLEIKNSGSLPNWFVTQLSIRSVLLYYLFIILELMIFWFYCFLKIVKIQKEAYMILKYSTNASSWHWNLLNAIFNYWDQSTDKNCERFEDTPPDKYTLLKGRKIWRQPKA